MRRSFKIFLPTKAFSFCMQNESLHISINSLAKGSHQFFDKHKLVKDPARQDQDYFEKEADKLQLDEHYLDKLKYLFEEKVSNQRDLRMKATDLLVGNATYGLPEIDRSLPRVEYRHADALHNAPDLVKRIFSVEMGERRDLTTAWKAELISRVNSHEFDQSSIESKIAWATACIRHGTALVDELIPKRTDHKHPKKLIRQISLLIDWRRKMLKQLRETNYESFQRVISELKLAYQVPRDADEIRTRKEWVEFQLRRRCDREKERRLHALHERLQEGRDEHVVAIDEELRALDDEEAEARRRIAALDVLEGRTVANIRVRYEPKLIEEFTELMIHRNLFYHPSPIASRTGGLVATS